MGNGAGKRVLVAGGAGFLGSNLCRRLVADGHQITCLDNFRTGHWHNISGIASDIRIIRHDITESLPRELKADAIYNLACPASPRHYQADPVHTLLTSVRGSQMLLGLAQRCSARIFQSSTSEVYGNPQVHPQPESYWGHVNMNGPRACYDEGKRCAEALFFDQRRIHGTEIKVGRIFNTYGPFMDPDDGRVISNFIVQALRNTPITLYGDGSQTRSFCYVDDLIELVVQFMESDADLTGPLNMGNPDERSVQEIAELILDLVGSRSSIVYRPLPIDDPERRCPDVSMARDRLGWQPTTSLETGLALTVAYFERRLGAGRTRLSRSRHNLPAVVASSGVGDGP